MSAHVRTGTVLWCSFARYERRDQALLRKKVIGMLLTEYDEVEQMELFKEEGCDEAAWEEKTRKVTV